MVIFMLKKVNKLQNAEICLHFLGPKCPLTQVGVHCKSNHVAYTIRMTPNRCFEQNISKIDKSKL